MSAKYAAVQWSRHKLIYDAFVLAGIALYVGLFFIVSKLIFRTDEAISDEVIAIRATGSCAIVLLHITLSLGPLARLQPRLLPVLFNRRHLGVISFLLALVHAVITTGYYHGFGAQNPLVSLLASNTSYESILGFPFEIFGLGALLIMFLLAATSHDFWLKQLTARLWKALHMAVYGAYAMLVLHVALGPMQGKMGILPFAFLLVGMLYLGGLHVWAGLREWRADGNPAAVVPHDATWIDAGPPADVPMNRAKVIRAADGERIAIFRHAGGFSAVTNVCAHQGGPLGEGAVIDGCITCPWHGWQYRPGDGCAPPPFTEKIRTYPIRILAGRVQVRAEPLPPGTPTVPAPEVPHGHD